MGFLVIQPRYVDWLTRLGLKAPRRFLNLQGEILSGHHDRHVLQLALPDEGGPVRVLLKKEHRVPWRDRLRHAFTGIGLVSKSTHEAHMLLRVQGLGIGCPEVMAWGEVRGQAFLLLARIPQARDVPGFLHDLEDPEARRRLALALGQELARVHQTGLCHGDLYAKHVLVDSQAGQLRFWFVDWQRGRLHRRLSCSQRSRDLVALHVSLTLQDDERAAFLTAYQRAASLSGPTWDRLIREVAQLSSKLQQKQKTRDLRQPPLVPGSQSLIWVDGEAICLTPEFHAELAGKIPAFLQPPPVGRIGNPSCEGGTDCQSVLQQQPNDAPRFIPGALLDCRAFEWTGERRLTLTRRLASWSWRWLWAGLCRKSIRTPEFQQAVALFRLERHGVSVPKLLGVGQRFRRPWSTFSFVLTEAATETIPLSVFLRQTSAQPARPEVLERWGEALRRVHEAGYVFSSHAALEAWGVTSDSRLVLNTVAGLTRVKTRVRPKQQDLARASEWLSWHVDLLEARHLLKGYRPCLDGFAVPPFGGNSRLKPGTSQVLATRVRVETAAPPAAPIPEAAEGTVRA